jgi:hypothetical protein
MKKIEKENQQKVLNEFYFKNEETQKRITKSDEDFLMSELDFIDYLKLV